MSDKFINFITENPKKVLCAICLFVLILSPGSFLIKEDFTFRAWYQKDDPLLKSFDFFEKVFGNDDSVILTIHDPNGIVTYENLKIIHEITEIFWTIPSISRVDSITNFEYIDVDGDDINVAPLSDFFTDEGYLKKVQKSLSNNLIENYLVSKDEKMAIIRGKVARSFKKSMDHEKLVNDVQALKNELSVKYPKLLFDVAGTAVFLNVFKEITIHDLGILIPLLISFFTIILFSIFRNLKGIGFSFLVIWFSVSMMLSLSGFLGHFFTTISSAAPAILITIAIADAIHILTAYYIALKNGLDNKSAVHYSLRKNFLPTLLTSITTSIGFLAFSNSLIKSISDLGVEVGFGVLFAWISTYMVLGPVLILFPFKAQNKVKNEKNNAFKISNRTKKIVALIEKNYLSILFGTLLIFAVSISLSTKLKVNLDPNSQFKKDHPYIIAYDKVTSHFGSISNAQFIIKAPESSTVKSFTFLQKVEKFNEWLNTQNYIVKTLSILDIIKDINRSLNQNDESYYKLPDTDAKIAQNLFFYSLGLPQGRELNEHISLDDKYMKLTAVWNIETSKEALEKISLMEEKAKQLNLDAKVTGKMPIFHQLTPYIVESFLESFGIAIVSITIILGLLLKSIKLGLISLIPNIIPLVIGSGLYALSGEFVDVTSVLICAICLGISVDDSIHFLFEFQKNENKGIPVLENIQIIYSNTAKALINTSILISIGFASFIFADYLPNARFGVMISIILMIALFADLIILPALFFALEKVKKRTPLLKS